MIPTFPKFKKLEVLDKADVEKITSKFAPYSDFNFLSLWSWDTKGLIQISKLHGNLVVKFTDYLTKEQFYSFIGNKKVNETALALLELSKKEKIKLSLNLIPEETAEKLDKRKFLITEERSHFDYIYPVDEIKSYKSSAHKKQREVTNSFARKYNYTVKKLDLAMKPNHKLLLKLVHHWIKNKKATAEANKIELEDYQNEYLAFNRMLSAPPELLKSVSCFSVFVDGKLSGFMVDEKVSNDYCVSHFGKINKSHSGNMQILMKHSAEEFSSLGVKFYNDEQDLGLETLRKAKSSYMLDHFLKKYSVSLSK